MAKLDENQTEIQRKVKELMSVINNSKKELEDIRKNCTHKETEITNDPESTTYSVRKVCIICEKAVGYPTNGELSSSGYSKPPTED